MDRFEVFGVVVLARVRGSHVHEWRSWYAHGRSVWLRQSSSRLHFSLCAVAALAHTRSSSPQCSTAVACSVGTQYGVKYPGRRAVRAAAAPASGSPLLLLGSLIAADNLLWRARRLDRELRLRRRDRRSAARPVPPSYRAFAELFCRPPARHAHKPRHRDVERGVHRREHVRLERAAALRGHGGGDCAGRHRQLADGGWAQPRRGRHGRDHVPAGRAPAGRCTTISPARRPPSTAK